MNKTKSGFYYKFLCEKFYSLLVIHVFTNAGIILKWILNKKNVEMCPGSGSG
jgi:hypothetical protein